MRVIFAPNAQRELQVQNERLRRENGALHDEIERLRRALSVAHTENEGLRVGRAPIALPPASNEETRTGAAVATPALPSQAAISVTARAGANATPAADLIPVARRMAPGEVLGAMARPYGAPVQVIHASSSVRNHARPTIFVSAIGGGRNPTGPTVQMMAPPNGPATVQMMAPPNGPTMQMMAPPNGPTVQMMAPPNGPTVQMMAPPNGPGLGTRPVPTPIPPIAPGGGVGGGAGPRVFLMAADGVQDAARTAMPAPPSGPQTVVGAPRGSTWPAVQMLPAGAARQGSGWPTVAIADIARRELAAPAVQMPAVGQVVAAASAPAPSVAAGERSASSREAARPIMQLTAANVLPDGIDHALDAHAAPAIQPSRSADIAAQHAPAVTVQIAAPTPSRAVAVARPASSREVAPPAMQWAAADVLPNGILLASVHQPVPPGRFSQPATRDVRDTEDANAIALPAASEPLDDAATRFAMLELD